MATLDVRPIGRNELSILDELLPTQIASHFANQLDMQDAGLSVFLVAWLGARPLGYLNLRWDGSPDLVVRERCAECETHAYIEGVVVEETHRSQGIGTRLLTVAEELARSRSKLVVGLAVGVANTRARALYERLGYREDGRGYFYLSWTYRTTDGRQVVEGEDCVYLTKSL